MVTIRELLNKLKWTGKLSGYELVYISRGSPGNEEVLSLDRVTRISRDGFLFLNEDGSETYIPYHRVLEIRRKDGAVLFRRSIPH